MKAQVNTRSQRDCWSWTVLATAVALIAGLAVAPGCIVCTGCKEPREPTSKHVDGWVREVVNWRRAIGLPATPPLAVVLAVSDQRIHSLRVASHCNLNRKEGDCARVCETSWYIAENAGAICRYAEAGNDCEFAKASTVEAAQLCCACLRVVDAEPS